MNSEVLLYQLLRHFFIQFLQSIVPIPNWKSKKSPPKRDSVELLRIRYHRQYHRKNSVENVFHQLEALKRSANKFSKQSKAICDCNGS